jgi:hypothetical protein
MNVHRIAISCALFLSAMCGFAFQTAANPERPAIAEAQRLNTLGAGYMNKQDFE